MRSKADIYEKLIWSWIKILAEIIPRFPSGSERFSSLVEELLDDFSQFIALAEQLEMRLSVCPQEPWSQFQWGLDFKIFLDQLLRRSHYCLSHLVSLFNTQYIT